MHIHVYIYTYIYVCIYIYILGRELTFEIFLAQPEQELWWSSLETFAAKLGRELNSENFLPPPEQEHWCSQRGKCKVYSLDHMYAAICFQIRLV